jgi:hypothetical protein
MVPTSPLTNAIIAVKLVTQKIDALNLWGIQNGRIIVVTPERIIPRGPSLLRLKMKMMSLEKLRH